MYHPNGQADFRERYLNVQHIMPTAHALERPHFYQKILRFKWSNIGCISVLGYQSITSNFWMVIAEIVNKQLHKNDGDQKSKFSRPLRSRMLLATEFWYQPFMFRLKIANNTAKFLKVKDLKTLKCIIRKSSWAFLRWVTSFSVCDTI